jgi:hypothetical protein
MRFPYSSFASDLTKIVAAIIVTLKDATVVQNWVAAVASSLVLFVD